MNMLNIPSKVDSWEYLLLRAAQNISLSESKYTQIMERYNQLEKILTASNNPLLAEAHIFPQGSMRLRTTIKPVLGAPADLGTVDADAIIWLPNAQGVEASVILEAIEERFKEGARVQKDIQPLRRGIRIVYADVDPGFHIDVTPARAIDGNDEEKGEGKLEVPDRVTGWKASSPIPYANWLKYVSYQKIELAMESYDLVRKHQAFDAATQEELPAYSDYSDMNPLIATIKLLKRHRDEWAIRTGCKDWRPISAVITTLATHAYADVVKMSASNPLRPLDAILAIVRKMPDYIQYLGGQSFVCNPEDAAENFAEKWNRVGEGYKYKEAFFQWHANAMASVSIGLEDFSSYESFEAVMKEKFGLSGSFISQVNREIPPDWTQPGRVEGTTRNAAAIGILFGGESGSENIQNTVKPVGRLG